MNLIHPLSPSGFYRVVYKVLGIEYRAGPYPEREIESQRDDIAGYGGVTDVRIEPADPPPDHGDHGHDD